MSNMKVERSIRETNMLTVKLSQIYKIITVSYVITNF